MPGKRLGIGETNPKIGAVQYDARRIDGISLIINSAATGVSDGVPIGTICTLQEDTVSKKQFCVTGLTAVPPDEYGTTMKIIGYGALEVSAQSGINSLSPLVGMFKTGDAVTFVRGIDAVIMAPVDQDNAIDATNLGIGAAYVTKAGKLAKTNAGSATLFAAGIVFLGVPALQMKGQLKTGYAFVRIAG